MSDDKKYRSKKAKLYTFGRNQVLRLPKEFQFEGSEVFIIRDGVKVILSPKPNNWDFFFKHAPRVTDDFMKTREDLPI